MVDLPFRMEFIIHYACYETHYVNQIQRLGGSNPGTRKKTPEEFGRSICRKNFGIRHSLHLAGEETFMKSTKAAGRTNWLLSVTNF